MNSVRKSLLTSFAEKYTVAAIEVPTSLVIARLLTPEEIGVFSVAAVLVSLAHMLRDFGVGQYIIQEKELTPDRFRTAFGFTLLFAWAIAGLLILISLPVAMYYHEPGIRDVIIVLALNFFLLPFSSVVLASLRREMNFTAIYRDRCRSQDLQ